jgi:uncharacterized protein DUF5678
MKAKANKPIRRPRKKPVRSKSAQSAANAFSSIGSRTVENEWLNKHPEKLRPHAGEYVVVEGRRIVAHSRDAAVAIQTARRRGITSPYIFFVEPAAPPNTFRIGL